MAARLGIGDKMGKKIGMVLFLALLSTRLIPSLAQSYALLAVWRDWPAAASAGGCDAVALDAAQRLTDAQRAAVSGLTQRLGCVELTAALLPELEAENGRSPLILYHLGQLAWAQGDPAQAAAAWRELPGIEQSLLARARQLRQSDMAEAMLWYEAAILSATDLAAQADALAAYTVEARAEMGPTLFRERLAWLAASFGEESGMSYRLRGQRSFMMGNYQTAVAELEQALALGQQDAETWYWLGEAARNMNDWAKAEAAYRQALDSPAPVPWRRPWHLDRLAGLLVALERPLEALPFQEEAVRLDNNYYYYADNLALLYGLLDKPNQAQALCQQARRQAGRAGQTALRCEQP